jgi:hypothetical protein
MFNQFFFFLGGVSKKRNSIKKCKGAPKHTKSIQEGYQNKRKIENKGRTPEKTQRQKKG